MVSGNNGTQQEISKFINDACQGKFVRKITEVEINVNGHLT